MTCSYPGKTMSTRERNFSVDVWKALAALSIIWLHTVTAPPLYKTANLGRFAVPFFAATSVYLAARKPHVNLWKYSVGRIKRIYTPFLIWSLAYLIVRYLASNVTRTSLSVTAADIFISGTAQHLWFLPFILCASVISHGLFLSFAKLNSLCCCTLSSILFLVMIAWFMAVPNLETYGYVVHLSNNAFGGAMFGLIAALHPWILRKIEKVPLATLAFLGSLIFLWIMLFGRNIALENLLGILAFLMAFICPSRKENKDGITTGISLFLEKVGTVSFSAYLIHILFVEGFQDIASLLNIQSSIILDGAIFLSSSFLSFSIPLFVKKIFGIRKNVFLGFF